MDENFYRQLIENSPQGYAYCRVFLDDNNILCDYEYLEMNAAYEEITGLKAAVVIGKRSADIQADIKRSGTDLFISRSDTVIKNGDHWDIAFSEITKRFYSVHLLYPEAQHLVIFTVNITRERLEAEEKAYLVAALREKENRITGFWGTQQDITQWVHLRKLAEAKEKILSAMARFTQEFYVTNDAYEAWSNSVPMLQETVGISMVDFWEHCIDPETGEWYFGRHHKFRRLSQEDAADFNKDRLLASKDRDNYKSVMNGQVTLFDVKDIPGDGVAEFLKRHNIRSSLQVPVFVKGQFIGTITFSSPKKPNFWFPEEIELLKSYILLFSKALERQRMETEIRQMQQNFDNFFNNNSDLYLVLDMDHCILYTNDTVSERLGYLEEELTGRVIEALYTADSREKAVIEITDISVGAIGSVRQTIFTKDGFHIPVETRVTQGEWNGQPAFYVVIKDITQQRYLEELAETKERILSAMVRFKQEVYATNDAFEAWTKSIAMMQESAGIAMIDFWEHCTDADTGEWYFGHSSEFMRLSTVLQGGHPHTERLWARNDINQYTDFMNGKVLLEGIDDITNERIAVRFKAVGYRSSLKIPAFVKGQFFGLFIFSAYKTADSWFPEEIELLKSLVQLFSKALEKQLMEVELIKSEEKFTRIFRDCGVAMTIYRSDKRLLDVNDTFLNMIGYEREEVIGNTLEELKVIPHRDEGYTVEEFLAPADSDGVINQYEGEIIDKEQRVHNVIISTVPVDVDNEPCLLSAIMDITERKRMTEELEKAKIAAEEASKAKSEFLSQMTHEIRTPMNAMIGYTDLLLQSTLVPKEKNYLNNLKVSATLLLQIVNDILTFEKIEKNELPLDNKVFSLDELIGVAFDQLAVKIAAKGLKVGYTRDPDIPDELYGDPLRLQQVLINLLDNAIKFTSRGGVSLQIKRLSDQKQRVHLQFEVRDTGIGMSKDQMMVVFEPFKQGDASIGSQYGGTGLGLSISKKIVALFGGEIWVESAVNQGSAFYFTVFLPMPDADVRCQAISDQEREVRAEKRLRALNNVKVLVTDDNEINRDVLKEILETAGISVVTVESGQKAIDAVTEKEFDLILMDIRMPEMNGYEAARRIRQRWTYHDLPIIAVTASALSGEIERCREAGINDLMIKPIEREILLHKMIKWLNLDAEDGIADSGNYPGKKEKNISIQGIDMAQAMEHLLGNRELFMKLLKKIRNNQKNTVQEIELALQKSDKETAQRLAHTAKGVAAEIAALAVHKAASELERAIIKGDYDNTRTQLKHLSQELECLFSGIDQFVNRLGKESEKSLDKDAESKSIDLIGIKPLLGKLETLLLDSDLEAISYLDQITSQTQHTTIAPKLIIMKEYSDRYDFDGALTVLYEIYNTMNQEE